MNFFYTLGNFLEFLNKLWGARELFFGSNVYLISFFLTITAFHNKIILIFFLHFPKCSTTFFVCIFKAVLLSNTYKTSHFMWFMMRENNRLMTMILEHFWNILQFWRCFKTNIFEMKTSGTENWIYNSNFHKSFL